MSILAAEYVRMSTDLQQYSIENQKSAIQQYALQHGFAVIKTWRGRAADTRCAGNSYPGAPSSQNSIGFDSDHSTCSPFNALL